MSAVDDPLTSEMIGLLRDVNGKMGTISTRMDSTDRALLALNSQFGQLISAGERALVRAVWGLVAAIIAGSGLLAAAIIWT